MDETPVTVADLKAQIRALQDEIARPLLMACRTCAVGIEVLPDPETGRLPWAVEHTPANGHVVRVTWIDLSERTTSPRLPMHSFRER